MLPAARIALTLLGLAPAVGLAQPATLPSDSGTEAVVRAVPGFAGQWTVQQWAPLRLVFRDPGPADAVELFCDEAGPTFRAGGTPAPVGESFIDLAVYPQVPSNRWKVRLIHGAAQREFHLDLGVDFGGYRPGRIEPPQSPPLSGSFQSPPVAMQEAAAQWHERTMPDVFGPEGRNWLVDPDFYRVVWTSEQAAWPAEALHLPLALLAGGLLVIAAIGVMCRRRPLPASLLAAGALGLTAGGVGWFLARQPGHIVAQLTLVTCATPASFEGPGQSQVAGTQPIPLRRQTWTCIAAHRSSRYELTLNAGSVTPRVVLADLAERPAVVLPAAWTVSAGPCQLIQAQLARGDYQAFLSTTYKANAEWTGSRLAGTDNAVRWVLSSPLADAYLVSNVRAYPLGQLSGRGSRTLNPDQAIDWASVHTVQPGDDAVTRLKKRLTEYWSTRTPRGGRNWLVGWSAGRDPPAARRRLDVPELVVIDLGPISNSGPVSVGSCQFSVVSENPLPTVNCQLTTDN